MENISKPPKGRVKIVRNMLPPSYSSWVDLCQSLRKQFPDKYKIPSGYVCVPQETDWAAALTGEGLSAPVEYEIDIVYAKMQAFQEIEECGDIPPSGYLIMIGRNITYGPEKASKSVEVVSDFLIKLGRKLKLKEG